MTDTQAKPKIRPKSGGTSTTDDLCHYPKDYWGGVIAYYKGKETEALCGASFLMRKDHGQPCNVCHVCEDLAPTRHP